MSSSLIISMRLLLHSILLIVLIKIRVENNRFYLYLFLILELTVRVSVMSHVTQSYVTVNIIEGSRIKIKSYNMYYTC